MGECPAGSGKEKDILGNCVCPEGTAENELGVCEGVGPGTGAGECPAGSGKEKDILGNCVCPEGTAENELGVCEGPGTGGGQCTGGKTKDVAGNCVCPEGTEDVDGQCVGSGGGEEPEEETGAMPFGFNTVTTAPGELVEIDSLFNISGPSIFREGTKTLAQEDPLASLFAGFAEGGIVQEDNDIEQLIRFLENQRG